MSLLELLMKSPDNQDVVDGGLYWELEKLLTKFSQLLCSTSHNTFKNNHFNKETTYVLYRESYTKIAVVFVSCTTI